MSDIKLEIAMWLTVMWLCVLFYAFVAGVWYDENVKPAETKVLVKRLMKMQESIF